MTCIEKLCTRSVWQGNLHNLIDFFVSLEEKTPFNQQIVKLCAKLPVQIILAEKEKQRQRRRKKKKQRMKTENVKLPLKKLTSFLPVFSKLRTHPQTKFTA